jgi:superfamily I DNA/RNA helicase
LDSRAGRTLKAVFTHDDEELLDYDTDLRPIVRGGLSARGQQAWDNISEREVLARIRRHDWSVLSIRPQHIDYLRGLDYSREQNLRISTMHGAKGLQGDDVHLILSLSQRAWAEFAINPDHLHRLLYTAVTRTKENLYLYDGENGYELPTEFR